MGPIPGPRLKKHLNLTALSDLMAHRVRREKRKTGIYFLFKGDVLVYVGLSVNVLGRVHGHEFKDWDSYAFIEAPDIRDFELALLERAYMVAYRPKYNSWSEDDSKQRRINRIKRLPTPVEADSLA